MGKWKLYNNKTRQTASSFHILSVEFPEVWDVDFSGEWGDFGGSQAENLIALNQKGRIISFQLSFSASDNYKNKCSPIGANFSI